MKIALIQLAKFGDIIQTLPVFADIRAHWPLAEITLIHSDVFSALAELLPFDRQIALNLDEITDARENTYFLRKSSESLKWIRILQSESFDFVFNLNSNPMAKELAYSLSPDFSGFGAKDEKSKFFQTFVLSFLKTRRLNTLNLADIFRLLFRISISFPNQDILYPPSWTSFSALSNPEMQTVFQLGSRNPKRQISLCRYAELADSLIARGHKIVLTGTREEKNQGEDFCRLISDQSSVDNLIGKTNFKELMSVLRNSRWLITGDTGTMHFSGLSGNNIAALFNGTAYPFETLAYTKTAVTVFPDFDDNPCYPCPDYAPCSQNHHCSELSVHEISERIIENRESPRLYRTAYDRLGQYLIPDIPSRIHPDIHSAFIWRSLLERFLFREESVLSHVHHEYLIDDDLSDRSERLIKREKMLFDRMRNQDLSFELILNNFNILAPLLIHRLIDGKESEFIDFVLTAL